MHNNFYFLRQVSQALNRAIKGYTLVSCFSQNKEELVLEFTHSKKSFYLKASLQSGFCCLSFPDHFNRARKNSVNLFLSIVSKKVTGVGQYQNERSFSLSLESNLTLLFKMHGNRANVVLFEGNDPVEIFRNHLKGDLKLDLTQLDKLINLSKEYFTTHHDQLKKVYFTFGKEVWSYLSEQGFDDADIGRRWTLFSDTLAKLEHPEFFILEKKEKVLFSLLPSQKILFQYSEPLEAITKFYSEYQTVNGFYAEKSVILKQLESQLAGNESYVQKNLQRLNQLNLETHYQQWADLIMANLQSIRLGMEKISLENFYDHHKPVEIKLNKAMNAQSNAAVFYRKAKNRQIGIQKLNESIAAKEKDIVKLQAQIAAVRNENDLQGLRGTIATATKSQNAKEVKQSLPYHEFEFKGFKIWVGKNADHNDTLTTKYAFKDDLWLHAKDVAGSHVLIKHQAGKNFPKEVIERAAELAAYNSKRKNESLCPVTVTPRKFVRKRKGDPAGAVVVEREEVILVKPAL